MLCEGARNAGRTLSGEDETPALSVVVPVRGRAAALDRLLRELADEAVDVAARGQAGALEVIVVDDASDPPLAPIGPAGLALRLLRHPVRCGANAARRAGLLASTGHLAHFHDSDDGLTPGWLAAILAAAAAEPDAGVILTARLDVVDGRTALRRQAWVERWRRNPARIRRMLAFRNCLGPFGGLTFKRDLVLAARFPDAASSQDWLVCCDVYDRGPLTAVAQTRFVYRRDGADRISASPRRKALGMLSVARRTQARSSPCAWRRYYHLHYFRGFLAACRRREIDRILRRTALRRRLAHMAALVYMAVALRLW